MSAELAERFFADLLCGGDDRAKAILSDDVRIRSSLGGEVRGHDGFEDFFQAYRRPFGSFNHEIIESVSDYHGAALRVRFAGYHRNTVLGIDKTGRDVAWKAAAFFEIEDSLITDVWILDDLDALRSAIRGAPAPHQVTVYWSMQSPYCYLLLPRLEQLAARADVEVTIKPVRPGVIRKPEAYRGRSEMEMSYFDADVARTAAYEGIDIAEPNPSPVSFKPGTWEAADEQPVFDRLYTLLMAAAEADKALDFLGTMMRWIWSGDHPHWDKDMEAEFAWLELTPKPAGYQAELEANEADMYAAGHWGVPLTVYRGEAFYGQDRWDQLLWRIEENE